MSTIKNIFRNIHILNILLLLGVAYFAYYLFTPIFDLGFKYMPPAVKNTIPDKADEPLGNHPDPSISDYILISDKNLFHPERKIPVEKKADEQGHSLPIPEFVLYGTLITDDVSLAYLEDIKAPRNTPGIGKRQTAMRIGDSLGGFVLKQIESDKITMARGEEKMSVSVHNSQRNKIREAPTSKAGAQTASGQPKNKTPKQSPVVSSPPKTPFVPTPSPSMSSGVALPPAPFEK